MKRVCSLLLAMCLALSLCGAAFAEEAPETTVPPAAVPEEEPVPPAALPETEEAASATDAVLAIPSDVRIIEWMPRSEEEPAPEDGETGEGEETPAEEPAEETPRPSYLYAGLDPENSVGNIIVSNGLSWTVENNCVADRVEIDPGAIVEADHPVTILFSESDTVQDGEIRDNIRFIRDYDEVIAIVHTNDTRGYLTSEPYVKGLADQLKDSGLYSLVLTVNAGNVYAGGFAAAHVYNGEYIPYVMGGVYDFTTWGRDDVSLAGGDQQAYFLSVLGSLGGMTTLAANRTAAKHMDVEVYTERYTPAAGEAEFASLYDGVLSLNEDGTVNYAGLEAENYALERFDNVLDDGAVIETEQGTRLGLFGLAYYESGADGSIFVSENSSIATAQRMADALRAEGADVVVGFGSTGWWGEDSQETGDNDVNAAQLVRGTTGIDAYIDGGTGAVIANGGGWLCEDGGSASFVNEAGANGEAIGVMYIILKDGAIAAICGENITPREDGSYPGIVPDGETWARVSRVGSKLSADGYTTAYSSTEEYLNGDRLGAGSEGGSVRANETNLGDLVADGLLWMARQRWTGESVSVALYPGSWIGTSIRPGYITLADAMALFAQPMQLVYREYTARELVALMSDLCANLGQDSDTMYQTAGLVCTYDPDTLSLLTLAVDDILYYDHGEYLMDESHIVRCVTAAALDDDVGEEAVIVDSNTEIARLWCEFLQSGSAVIHTNEIHPDWRVYPAVTPEAEETESAEGA